MTVNVKLLSDCPVFCRMNTGSWVRIPLEIYMYLCIFLGGRVSLYIRALGWIHPTVQEILLNAYKTRVKKLLFFFWFLHRAVVDYYEVSEKRILLPQLWMSCISSTFLYNWHILPMPSILVSTTIYSSPLRRSLLLLPKRRKFYLLCGSETPKEFLINNSRGRL
jgi:hypothetical protein